MTADDEPATEAGAANDETEVVDDEHLRDATGGQAWSDAADDADDAESHHPWSAVTGQAAVLISVGAAVAAVTVMVGWLLLQKDRPAPLPVPTPTAEKSAPPAPAPPPPPTVTVTATTQIPTQTSTAIAATGPIMGSPCGWHDHAKLATAQGTGQEIFCHAEESGGEWEATPSDVTGVHIMYSSCEAAKPHLARSSDGYLITCKPAGMTDGFDGSALMWQRYRAMFDPGV